MTRNTRLTDLGSSPHKLWRSTHSRTAATEEPSLVPLQQPILVEPHQEQEVHLGCIPQSEDS